MAHEILGAVKDQTKTYHLHLTISVYHLIQQSKSKYGESIRVITWMAYIGMYDKVIFLVNLQDVKDLASFDP